MLHKKAATAASSSVGVPMMHPGKGAAGSGSGSTGAMLEEKAAAASSGVAPTTHPRKGAVDTGSSGEELPEKKTAASSGGSAALGALDGNTTAQDCEESDAKHSPKKPRTISSGNIPREHSTEDEGSMGSSGGMLQKQSPNVEADTGSSGDTLHKHLAEEADTAKGIQEPNSNDIVHAKRIQEAEDLIQQMNAACIGEQISSDEFLDHYERLARSPPCIDLDDKVECEDMEKIAFLHALYRLRYLKYKFRQQTSEEELLDDKLKSLLDKSEDDCDQKFLQEEGYFRRLEDDMTFDWFFHPAYSYCSSLTDYQRLVLVINYGGTEYGSWSDYHGYLYSYETEKEYVKYCKELSKKLKWIDDYVGPYCPSLQWDCITDRGAYQAIKIAATDFPKITVALAYVGFDECIASMDYDTAFFKEYDRLYFEIWKRVTQKSISFEVALEEVCKLNMFPLRQNRMKGALECDFTMEQMETEYQTCTKAIAPGDTEGKARKLIAEAVITRVNKPKSYEQYIIKKIEIARVIGILPREEDSDE